MTLSHDFKTMDSLSIEKIQRGLTAGSEELFQLIHDPDLEYVQILLKNHHITEAHLLTLLKRHNLSEELITAIYKRNKNILSHKLVVALVKNRAISGILARQLLPQLYLFELVDLISLPGSTPDQKLAAERVILQRLPTTPLGNKITLARRGSATIVAALVKEGHPQILEACLNNSHLKESAIYQFLQGTTATAETISMIARHNRWKQRSNLQLAILKNHKTPDIWLTLWLPRLEFHTVKILHHLHKNSPKKKQLIAAEIARRNR